ncbi:peptidoglycan-binding protein [Streptomyces parvulus]|uniref:peptidoglycan-binding protein n=1 Tax=Streptomyces parvulus TaxID=146923 RepID=UPI00369A05B4
MNGASAPATSPREGVVRRAASWGQDPDATMTLRAVGADGGTGSATEVTAALPTPLAPSAGSPSAQDLRLFETPVTASAPAPVPSGAAPADGTGGRRARRRRKGVLLSAAGAVVVMTGAAGYASGLFSYEAPSRDGALPDEVRASVPDPSTGEATPSGGARTAPAPAASAPPSPSASASASASPSASPSPSASVASPSPSRQAEASPAPTATTTVEAPSEPAEEDEPDFYGGPALSRGDRGPEVVELQRRLRQLYLYMGDAHGTYDRRVEDAVRTYQWARGIRSDGLGVYGADTRHMLETETREP